MNRAQLLRAIDMLPRYNNTRAHSNYVHNGKRCAFQTRMTPRHIDEFLHAIMKRREVDYFMTTQWVNVQGDNFWTLQRCLRYETLVWLAKRWTWNNWTRWRLPCYIKFSGKIIIWNGTHRTMISRLANRRVRAKVIDFDALLSVHKELKRKRKCAKT